MVDSPNYGYNRNPQFSVNHVAEYLAASNAPQRTRIICAAKFPKKVEITSYAQVKKPLKEALSKPDFGAADLAFLEDRMDTKARREIGYQRDEALRCARAIQFFREIMVPRKFSRYQISSAPKTIRHVVEGVKLNVTLDAFITSKSEDVTNNGGIVLVYAFSADRGDLRDRLATISGLTLWSLEGGQMEPLPRLCMAIDLAEKHIAKASSSHQRFRERVTESCKEITSRWSEIQPPEDYDGPDWN